MNDLTGQQFGQLTAKEAIKTGNSVKWRCQCSCGNIVVAYGYDLKRGRVISCGCRKVKHGGRYSRLYSIWQSMKKRCHNSNHKYYSYYGGRGITVCPEWDHDFSVFRDWALSHNYADNLTIDRIDSKKGYCPENCQWITGEENTRKADHERWHKS